MKMIVGLGNPGIEYKNTRHNIGFECIDFYAKKHNINIDINKFDGKYNVFKLNNENVILLKPQKYMNLSGEVVKKYADYFKIPVENILVINDDLDLKIGKIRLRSTGSSAGHNGLKNIELNLNTSNYKRLKIGISNDKDIDTKDYVLGKIDYCNLKIYDSVFSTIVDLLDDFNIMDFQDLMNKYNRR